MKHKQIIPFLFLIYSCSFPIKIYPLDKNNHIDGSYNRELIIYSSADKIEKDYSITAYIEVENKAIRGDLNFDNKVKSYLLDYVNDIGANAIIYNEIKSNKEFTCFDIIRYDHIDSGNNPISKE